MTLPLRLIKDSQRQGFIENCRAGSYPILRMIEILSWGINDLCWAKLAALAKGMASWKRFTCSKLWVFFLNCAQQRCKKVSIHHAVFQESFGKSNIFLVAAPTNHRMLDAPRLSCCPDCSRHREIGSNIILIWFHIEKKWGKYPYFLLPGIQIPKAFFAKQM